MLERVRHKFFDHEATCIGQLYRQTYNDTVVLACLKTDGFLSKLTSPIVWVLSKSTHGVVRLLGLNRSEENNKVTEEEIKAVVQEGFEGGEVQEVEQDIVEEFFILEIELWIPS